MKKFKSAATVIRTLANHTGWSFGQIAEMFGFSKSFVVKAAGALKNVRRDNVDSLQSYIIPETNQHTILLTRPSSSPPPPHVIVILNKQLEKQKKELLRVTDLLQKAKTLYQNYTERYYILEQQRLFLKTTDAPKKFLRTLERHALGLSVKINRYDLDKQWLLTAKIEALKSEIFVLESFFSKKGTK